MDTKPAPKYPLIEVDLAEADGNPVSVMSAMRMAMRAGKVPPAEVTMFFEEAMGQDSDGLIETCRKWVTVTAVAPVAESMDDLAA